ncbi:hypothetical protein DOTSEDRAFT_71249 [Dothistroma septosporum NZE10]|uniref:Uncharacterized protein n=1 Tax=Dothistroma septosporum (strain NZE10 / CBS 128990) TaxID=675120 RepID=N1PPW0_DOTSN|nr:hypothetical protein DOTSEDRAFT_71249 [Dothistroma septosporum NZE10]
MSITGAMTMGRLLDMVNDARGDLEYGSPAGTCMKRICINLFMTLTDDHPSMLDRQASLRFAVERSGQKKRRRHQRVA